MKSFHKDIMILQTWFSPAFPTGAFSYSHGLESAIQDNLINDAGSLKSWIALLLSYGSGRNDGLFLKAAYEGVSEANALCLALCGSKERLRETTELGQAFSRAVKAGYGVKLPDRTAYPVAVGVTAKQFDLDPALTLKLSPSFCKQLNLGWRSRYTNRPAGWLRLPDWALPHH